MRATEIDWDRLRREPAYAAQVCDINLAALDDAMLEQPGLYAYVAAQFEAAKVDETRAKIITERVRSQVFAQLMAGEEKMAVSKADKLLATDEAVMKATDKHLQTRADMGMLHACLRGLEHRLQMIMQISSKQKAEARHY